MITRVYRPTPHNLRRLAARLCRGGLVAVPTETVYGLAADAGNSRACRAVFRAKRRPARDPLIVHVADLASAESVAVFSEESRRLAREFWPGALTLILPKRPAIPNVVTAGLSTVAVRMPAHPVMRRLLRLCGRPLAAPSANPFGRTSPTSAEHVRRELNGRVNAILDGGETRHGLESTIVDLRKPGRPRLLRPGAIPADRIEKVLGRRLIRARKINDAAPEAPGHLSRHYSPRKPLVLIPRVTHDRLRTPHPPTGWIVFGRNRKVKIPRTDRIIHLGPGPEAAARRLFAALHRLDREPVDRIVTEPAPHSPLAESINDRLRRAAAPNEA